MVIPITKSKIKEMKKYLKYLMMALVAVCGLSLTSCSDDDVTLSRIVLASVDVLECDGMNPEVQLITITSDGDWYVEAPEWITVTPSTGTVGQTVVELTLDPNVRDGELDNPRRANVLFKGRNLASIATVLVRQNGDKYRDPLDYTISEMEAVEENTVVKLPNMQIAAVTATGFVATDGTRVLYVVKDDESPEQFWSEPVVGKVVDIVGEKLITDLKLPYVLGGKLTVVGDGTNAIEATEITSVDNLVLDNWQYVSVEGTYNITDHMISVSGSSNRVYFYDTPKNLDFTELDGHKIIVKGYYGGTAEPMVRLIPESLVDEGLNETVYFFEDFEWMEPWSNAANVHDYIAESETLAAESKQIGGTSVDGVTLYQALLDRGYGFVKATGTGYEDRDIDKRVYFQRNYLKFSLTGIEAGVVLPSVEGIPDGEKIELLFDWSPMRQGNPGASGRAYDGISLVVIIDNGSGETQVPVPPHTLKKGGEHYWMKAQIDLSNFTINEGTKITIRSSDDRWPAYKEDGTCMVNRFFLDNVKLRKVLD